MNQEQITPEQRAEKRFPEIANTLNADRGDLYYLEQIPENFWTDGEKVRHGELQIRVSIQAGRENDNYVARKVYATCIREEVEPLEVKVAEMEGQILKMRETGDAMRDKLRSEANELFRTGNEEEANKVYDFVVKWEPTKSLIPTINSEVLLPGDSCHGPFDLEWVKMVFQLFEMGGYRVPNDPQEGKILFQPNPNWIIDVCYGTGRHLPPDEFVRRLGNLCINKMINK